MAYLDFDTLLVCNNYFDEESVKHTLTFFNDLGIRKFIFTYDYDRIPMSFAVSKFRTIKPYIKSCAPRGSQIYTSFNVLMSEGLVFEPSFKRLSLGHSDRIFINCPLFNYDGWLESDMNRLLYKNKLKPDFTSFERNLLICDRQMINRFLSIKNAVFGIDLNYLTAIKNTLDTEKIISRKINIMPCISSHIFNYPGVKKHFDQLKDRIGVNDYCDLLASFHDSTKEILKDAEYYPYHRTD